MTTRLTLNLLFCRPAFSSKVELDDGKDKIYIKKGFHCHYLRIYLLYKEAIEIDIFILRSTRTYCALED
jgi:hypothetical protein